MLRSVECCIVAAMAQMNSAVVLASVFLWIPFNTLAFCVVPPMPCVRYAVHHGQPTFIGVVLSEETVTDVIEFGEHVSPRTVQKATLKVEEPFDGMPGTTEFVYGEGSTNDLHFKVGDRYLVVGYREKDGKIRTSRCIRTAPVSEAAEDISFLRSLPTQVGGGVFGIVRFVSPGVQAGTLAGTITESGDDGDHKSRVKGSGSYELTGLAPGDYRETFTPDDTSTEFVALKLSIPVNGSCAASGVRLGNTSVSGNVIDDAGNPIPSMNVLLFYALDGKFHPDILLRTRTDALGKFNFDRVEAAKFILAAEPANSGMAFFPGTRDASRTEVIQVLDGKPLSALIVRVPGYSAQ
jgi:hypothetical protein